MDAAAQARRRVRQTNAAAKQRRAQLAGGLDPSGGTIDRLQREASKEARKAHQAARGLAENRRGHASATAFGDAASRRRDMSRQLAVDAAVASVDAASSATWMPKAEPAAASAAPQRSGASRTLGMYPGRKTATAVAAARVPSRRRRRRNPFRVLTPELRVAVLSLLPRSCVLAASLTCRSARVAGATALARSAAGAEQRLGAQRQGAAAAPAAHAPHDSTCPICLSEVEDAGSCDVCQLQCGHAFHADCIEAWLSRHSTCPVCRRDASGDSGGMSIGLLEAARLATQAVSRAELMELRMGARPTAHLLAVVGAVLTALSNGAVSLPAAPLGALMTCPPTPEGWRLWKRSQARLQDADGFLASLLDLEPLALTPSTLAKLAPFVESEELSPLNVERPTAGVPPPHAHATATLCRWFRAIYSCATTPAVREQLLQVRPRHLPPLPQGLLLESF